MNNAPTARNFPKRVYRSRLSKTLLRLSTRNDFTARDSPKRHLPKILLPAAFRENAITSPNFQKNAFIARNVPNLKIKRVCRSRLQSMEIITFGSLGIFVTVVSYGFLGTPL